MSCLYARPTVSEILYIPLASPSFSYGFLVSWVSASHMATLCSPFSILPMRDPKSGNVGVITTAETKENGVLLMQSHLSSNNIARDPKAFSVGQTAWNQKDKTSDADRFKLRIGELHSRKPV